MAQKRKSTFSKTLLSLLIGVPSVLSLIGNLCGLIGHEARLASKSLVVIIALGVVSALICTSIWLCLLALLFFYFVSLQWSPQFSLLVIILLNIILLLIMFLCIKKYKTKLLFPETRKRLKFH
jgi:hypothetical protein